MVPTFAGLGDYRERYGEPDDEPAVAALLEDASAFLAALMGKRIDACDLVQAANLRSVCCSMANRAMGGGNGAGVTQESATAGPYTRSFTYAGATRSIYLTKEERRVLGIGRSRFGSIAPEIGR